MIAILKGRKTETDRCLLRGVNSLIEKEGTQGMRDPGPEWVEPLLEWLRERLREDAMTPPPSTTARQGSLWTYPAYDENAPTIRDEPELRGAVEHLDYAVYRRYHNQLTRAERARLDNTIRNAQFKIDRYLETLTEADRPAAEQICGEARSAARTHQERDERQRGLARRADLKLAQLKGLTPEEFEEFVAEVFEALGYHVERVGGSGDDGADLLIRREALRAVVQCKYHQGKAVVGSPELQKFLGTVHHTNCHKGYFVTTGTFTLSAERFSGSNPIELIDGPGLVELVQQALGPHAQRESEPLWERNRR